MIAEKLNRGAGPGGLRHVALAHTEGCGSSGGESEILAMRTMAGYLAHPLVKKGLLLEHGCEKTHNDAMRNFLAEQNLDPNRFGWASIQMDGGIESVTAKVMDWFRDTGKEESPGEIQDVGLESVRIGLTSVGPVSNSVAEAFARLARAIAVESGTVVVAENSSLLASESVSQDLFGSTRIQATLAYGQRFLKSGFHIMETPTDHYVETLTGLGATGIEMIVAHVMDQLPQSHPMVPVLHIGTAGFFKAGILPPEELDLLLEDDSADCGRMTSRILELLTRVLSREYRPKLFACGNTDFQMTRGLLGVSM